MDQPLEVASPLEVANPFALMTSPETIFAAIERSERLARLKSTICRPLDKPRPDAPAPVDMRAFDAAVESSEIPEESNSPEWGSASNDPLA